MRYSSPATIWTVAKREMAITAKTRAVQITVALLLLVTIGGITAANFFLGSDDEPDTVAVVEMPTEAFDNSGLDARGADDADQAAELVRNGDAEAALVPGDEGWDLISQDGNPSQTMTATINQVVEAYSSQTALQELGVSPTDYAQALPEITVNLVSVDEADGAASSENEIFSVLTVLAAAMIIIFSVITFASLVGGRVTEEKSSRVVEIILSSVRPLDFLAGKILGVTIFGFVTTLVLVGAGAAALGFTEFSDHFSLDWGLFGVMLVGCLLGLLFFGSLYAAAGSLIQRTEDLQSTQTPILILLILTAYVPAFGWNSLDSTLLQVAGWLPPFSMLTAPMQYAVGNFGAAQLALSYLLFAATTAAVIWLVARIYRGAILNNGKKMTWRAALKG
ncbi:ABC transporter permease [Corynebacterium sp. HMSC04H06]|uniref:ABC transporter permease n=1 Tax=Corynebacterium sp. HMSC04H06 TaxID=1581050 RepID=UPI0008A2AE7E|nr:ABC transporter permease [Corynebacterium sp. HMSC04H06]OFS20015.1 ABC transporter permease [Corynebacterium sp. HMSC04H06]